MKKKEAKGRREKKRYIGTFKSNHQHLEGKHKQHQRWILLNHVLSLVNNSGL